MVFPLDAPRGVPRSRTPLRLASASYRRSYVALHQTLVRTAPRPVKYKLSQEAMVDSISVIGSGKLGGPMVACFAAAGFRVKAVDVNPQKVEAINRGLPPVNEPGLAELMQETGGRLTATRD